ncbi:MAG: hypothetical protein AAGH46_01225 [Bacteroidota bacterium]
MTDNGKGLGHLLTQNKTEKQKARKQQGKKGPGRPREKVDQVNFTIRAETSTKTLLKKLVKVKELTVPGTTSQGDVVKEALELLAKKMEMPEMEKKYAKFLENL